MKFVRIFVSLLLIVCSQTAFAENVTLWGTEHAVAGLPEKDPCKQQPDLILQEMSHPSPTSEIKKIPNFFHAQETNDSHESLKNFFGIEDPLLRKYLGVFYFSSLLVGQMFYKMAHRTPMSSMEYGTLIQSFYNVFLSKQFLPTLVNKYTNKSPEFSAIQGDIDVASGGRAGLGLLRLLDAYGSFLNIDFKALTNVLTVYTNFANKIGAEYFDQYIKPKASTYNSPIMYGAYKGKNAFDIFSPQKLFTTNIYFELNQTKIDQFEDAMMFWRNFFIVKNIQQHMKTHKNGNLLVWVGVDHIKGVVQLLHDSKLSPPDKENIRVITLLENRNVACHYNLVLQTMTAKNKPIQMDKWYEKYGKN